MASWQYRYIAVSVDGFVEQLVRYVNAGHYFYVTGSVPAEKVEQRIDQKLLERYSVVMARWERARRKQAGFASVHYLRYEQFFILIGTHGNHAFYDQHSPQQISDCRRNGIRFAGYSIRRSYCSRTNKWHTLVRLDKVTVQALKSHLLQIATRRGKLQLEDEIRSICFQPYRPVREQLIAMVRAVNRKRKAAGMQVIDLNAVRSRRRITKPFGESFRADAASNSSYSAKTGTESGISGKSRPAS